MSATWRTSALGFGVREVAKHGGGEMLLGEARHVRAIAGVAAGMVHGWQALVCADHQAGGVVLHARRC